MAQAVKAKVRRNVIAARLGFLIFKHVEHFVPSFFVVQDPKSFRL